MLRVLPCARQGGPAVCLSRRAAVRETRLLRSFAFRCFTFSGHGIERHLAYQIYFYVYWMSYALEAILVPAGHLQHLQAGDGASEGSADSGNAGVPLGRSHLSCGRDRRGGLRRTSPASSSWSPWSRSFSRPRAFLRYACCCLSASPFGPWDFRISSRIFGVSLGLGFLATINLVNAAWLAHNSNMYSTINVDQWPCSWPYSACIWSAYFAFPEPKRRIIVLPTTSPFLRWNQISMALGDDPGYVAVGGIPPELFAPAELEVMRRASAKMTPLETHRVTLMSA